MDIKKIKADDLRSPVDLGSHVTKGSLVRKDGASWRVQAVRETHPGLFEIQVQEEKLRGAEGDELTSPRRARWPVKATDLFDVVIENISADDPASAGLKHLHESEVYGFEVTGEDADDASDVLRSIGAWLDRQPDPPRRHLAPTGDGMTFEFRAELTGEGHRLFADARKQVLRFKDRIKGIRLFTGPSRTKPLPT